MGGPLRRRARNRSAETNRARGGAITATVLNRIFYRTGGHPANWGLAVMAMVGLGGWVRGVFLLVPGRQ